MFNPNDVVLHQVLLIQGLPVRALKSREGNGYGDYMLDLKATDQTGQYPERADPYDAFIDMQPRKHVSMMW